LESHPIAIRRNEKFVILPMNRHFSILNLETPSKGNFATPTCRIGGICAS
jgi:hypothetical protein